MVEVEWIFDVEVEYIILVEVEWIFDVEVE